MSDQEDVVAVDYVNVGDSYAYPNAASYRALRNGTLKHGQIFSVFRKTVIGQTQTTTSPTSGTVTWADTSQVDTTLYKIFQYNPAEIRMDIGMTPVAPAGSEQAGGAPVQGVGAMRVNFEMRFTREREVYEATNRRGSLGLTPAQAEIYRNVGVQKDIYDVFRVILAEQAGVNSLPADMSLRALTQRAFDLSESGGALYGRAVFVQFNSNLAFFGTITNFNIVYNKFNNGLVPVFAACNLSLDVLNAAPRSQLPTTPGSVTAASGTGSTAATSAVPSVAPGGSTNDGIQR